MPFADPYANSTNLYVRSLEEDDASSFGDEAIDFAKYGLSSAITSGIIGIINTGVAFGNALGADWESFDAHDTLQGMGLDATADYYKENKTVIDAVGFGVTSIVPGMLGLRALKAAQGMAAASTSTSKLAIGVRKALIPANQSKKLVKGIKSGSVVLDNRSQYIANAAKEGFHKAAVESVFAETAILLTSNQNPAINPDELDYFEAIRDNLGGLGFGLAFGTGVGGVINSAIGYQTLKRIGGEQLLKDNKMVGNVGVDSTYQRINITPGDRTAKLFSDRARVKATMEGGAETIGDTAGDSLNATSINNLTNSLQQVENDIKDQLLELTKGFGSNDKGNSEIAGALWAQLKDADVDDAANFLANANRVTTYDAMDALFDPAITKMEVVGEDDWIEATQKAIYGKDFDPNNVEQVKAASRASSADGVMIRPQDGSKNPILILDEMIKSKDEKYIRGVMYHEMGHANTDRLAQMLSKNPLGITTQLERLSRMHRPDHWKWVDLIPSLEKRYNRLMKDGNTSIEEMEEIGGLLKQAIDVERYLKMPEELMADSWAVLNTPESFFTATNRAPEVYKLFANNAAVKQRVGRSEALVDLQTMDMYAVPERSPTIADLGNVKYDPKRRLITYGKGETSGKVNLKRDFNIFDTNPEEASAHYYAASKSIAPLLKDMEVPWTDFATLNKVLQHHQQGRYTGKVTVKLSDKSSRTVELTADDGKAFRDLYTELKKRAIREIRNKDTTDMTPSQIARILDVDEEFANMSGLNGGTTFWSEAYPVDKPTVAKVQYKHRREPADPKNIEAIADVQKRIRTSEEATKGAFNSFMQQVDKTAVDVFPKAAWEVGENVADTATSLSGGAGFVRSFQGEYGKIESFAQSVAEANSKAKGAWHGEINDVLTANALRIKSNPQALAEASVLDSVLRRDKYTFAPAAPDEKSFDEYLISVLGKPTTEEEIDQIMGNIAKLKARGVLKTIRDNMRDGTIWGERFVSELRTVVKTNRLTETQMSRLQNAMETSVKEIKTPELLAFWRNKVALNRKIIEGKRTVASIRGVDTDLTDDILYPGPLDRRRYKHIKFVYPKKGNTMFSDGKPSIIGASTPEGLAAKEQMVRSKFGDEVIIRTNEEIEKNFRLKGEFDSQLALTDFHVDSAMINKGILSDMTPEPSPDLIDHYARHMNLEASNIIDNLTAARYNQEFALLEQYSNVSKQNQASIGVKADKPTKFDELINIMLNHETKGKFESWKTAQQAADKIASKIFNTAGGMFRASQGTADYERMNEVMKQYGMPLPYDDKVGQFIMQTNRVPETTLKELMPRVNAVASTLMLRLDGIQQMVNAFSLPITSVPEMKHLINSVPELQRQQALRNLSVAVPDGNGARMPSNMRLMMQATKDFFTDKELVQQYDDLGLMPSIVREIREGIDDVALNPSLLNSKGEVSKWKAGFDKFKKVIEKPSDFSESYVKFVAARTADLALTSAGITDEAIKRQAMLTYVKRVHANYTYAQRPGMFQGFAGQAIGLFQTYQFNLFQQLLRHVGDRNLAATTSMVGLQAGIFGAQGVPGFQLLNNYIGERSLEGNDFYTGANDILGNEVSDWVLYGLSSNFTKPFTGGQGIELYTRGDLTPRTPILIPTSISDIPSVSMATKFVKNITTTAKNIAQGVPIDTVFYEALAQNGVNRPLAGIGQILGGARTTTKGTILAATHDLDWWQKTTRILGSRDLNESIATQAFYRAKAYETARREKIQSLGVSAKRMIRSGEWDSGVYSNFMDEYVSNGGDADNFGTWMHNQAMGAEESIIHEMHRSNDNPQGRYMQKLLGADIEDYIDVRYNQ